MTKDPQKQDLFRRVLFSFDTIARRAGLTQTEVVILAAQYTGMAVANGPPPAQDAQLDVATKAMRDAHTTASIRRGLVVPVETRG